MAQITKEVRSNTIEKNLRASADKLRKNMKKRKVVAFELAAQAKLDKRIKRWLARVVLERGVGI